MAQGNLVGKTGRLVKQACMYILLRRSGMFLARVRGLQGRRASSSNRLVRTQAAGGTRSGPTSSERQTPEIGC